MLRTRFAAPLLAGSLALGVAAPATLAVTDAAPAAAAPAPVQSSLLSSIPVSGSLQGGGTFNGLLSITDLSVVNNVLTATGTLTGTATQPGGIVTQITQTFTNTPLSLLGDGPGASCSVLNLDLGPLHLDVLGLVVDLNEVQLDITAVRGPGNLLGNLLCAVAGLLDNGGPLTGIQNLLGQIGRII